jgi:hypothetical protein
LLDLRFSWWWSSVLFCHVVFFCILFNDGVRIWNYITKWEDNWKGYGRMLSWSGLRYYPGFCMDEKREPQKICQDFSKQRLEPGTSWVQNKNANHSTVTISV